MEAEDQIFDPAATVANAAAAASGAGNTASSQVAEVNGVTPQNIQQQNIRIGQPYDMTQQGVLQLNQEDFYPGPDLDRTAYDTGIVATPRSPQTPLGAISKAAALLQQRQQRLDQAMKDFDLYAGIGSAADPYDQNFKKIAVGKLNAWRQGVADAYTGGDIKKANRMIYTTPELRDQWRGLSMQLEAMGQESKWVSKEADAYLKKVASNDIEFSQDTADAAQKMLHALNEFRTEDGSQGDVMKQLSANREFQQLLSRDKFFKEYVVPGLEHAKNVESIVSKPTKNGTTWFITTTTDEDYDNLIGEMATQLSRVSGLDYAEAERYMKNRLGRQHKEKLDTASIFVPGGSGASQERTSISAGNAPAMASEDIQTGVDSYYQKLDEKRKAHLDNPNSPQLTPKERSQYGIISLQHNAVKKNGSVQRVVPSVIYGGQAVPLRARRYGDTYIAGETFERAYDQNGNPIKGSFYIVGREVGPEMQQSLEEAARTGQYGVVTNSDNWKKAPIVYKLVSNSLPDLNEYYKDHIPAGKTIVDVLESAVGGVPNAQAKPAQARELTYNPATGNFE